MVYCPYYGDCTGANINCRGCQEPEKYRKHLGGCLDSMIAFIGDIKNGMKETGMVTVPVPLNTKGSPSEEEQFWAEFISMRDRIEKLEKLEAERQKAESPME